jgi:hypothetical protein
MKGKKLVEKKIVKWIAVDNEGYCFYYDTEKAAKKSKMGNIVRIVRLEETEAND